MSSFPETVLGELRSTVGAKLNDAFLHVGARALAGLERVLSAGSLVEDKPFLDPAQFPWISSLEAAYPAMRAELDEVLRFREELPNFQDISTDQATLSKDDDWKTFFFYGYGFRSDANCAQCPSTAAALASIPGMKTGFFSILGPGKKLPRHRGPYKGVLRYHLGLRVPEPADASGIVVGGELAHWREGASLVFDDTYPHEAWNGTESDRVVLFVDFVRPLKRPVALLNDAVLKAISLSPFIQDGKRRHEVWERRFEQFREAGTSEGGPSNIPRPSPES